MQDKKRLITKKGLRISRQKQILLFTNWVTVSVKEKSVGVNCPKVSIDFHVSYGIMEIIMENQNGFCTQ